MISLITGGVAISAKCIALPAVKTSGPWSVVLQQLKKKF